MMRSSIEQFARPSLKAVTILTIAALAWILWGAFTPGGLPGLFSLNGILDKADAVGYAVCHRIDSRSFHIHDRALPLCARCSGMFLGAVLGLGLLARTTGRRGGMPSKPIIAIFLLAVLAFGVDGVNSYLHFFPGFTGIYQPNNLLRLLTGTGVGLGISAFLLPAFRQTVWQTWEEQPIVGWRELGLLLALGVLLDLLILWENPMVLYPLALLSSLGVVVLLATVYTMLAVMLVRRENQFANLRQLAWVVVIGATAAIIQIGAIDFARFWFTGTWSGFNF